MGVASSRGPETCLLSHAKSSYVNYEEAYEANVNLIGKQHVQQLNCNDDCILRSKRFQSYKITENIRKDEISSSVLTCI